MAQRVNVVLVDDLDGSDAVETVSFALDGVDYEIDLNAAHADALREALAPYVGHARKVGRGAGAKRGRAAASGAGAAGGGAERDRGGARRQLHAVRELAGGAVE